MTVAVIVLAALYGLALLCLTVGFALLARHATKADVESDTATALQFSARMPQHWN